MLKDGWFFEKSLPMSAALKVKEHLYSGKSKYQKIDIIDTYALGKVLLLDEIVMTSDVDEFFYHESIVHPTLSIHPNPQKVMIIGGGDGGTAREVLKYKSVKEVEMVEIDEEVVNISKKYFPAIACELENPKLKLKFEDAIEYVKNAAENSYDVILCDCTDPNPDTIAAGLISKEFYKNIKKALKPDGIYVSQSGSILLQEREFKFSLDNMRAEFKDVKFEVSIVPSYPGASWAFLLASDLPIDLKIKNYPQGKTKYWNKDLHEKLFAIPQWLKEKHFTLQPIK